MIRVAAMSDPSEISGYVGGVAGIGALIIAAVKWLGGRVVQHEDDDKRQLQQRQEEAAKTERSIERTLIGLQHDVQGLRSDFANSAKQFENRALQQDKAVSDLRAELKEDMRQLEHRTKGDVQRMITASLPPSRKKG